MPYIYIGSHALNQYRERSRPVKDIDLIADLDTAQIFLKAQKCTTIFPINQGKTYFGRTDHGTIYEIEIAWPDSTGAELISLNYRYGDRDTWPLLDMLYALKMSHRYRKNSPHFLKTMSDIWEMRNMGAKIPEYLEDWFKRREKETYDYSHPNLNQNKDGFFSGDGVNYIHDHDSLHEAVAINSQPMYRSYQKDGSEVLCDKKKWDDLIYTERCIGVYEEACVLALERSVIPHPGVLTPRQAFELALMKICTSITSGWFREFAWENYYHIIDMYSDNYVIKFEEGKENGTVRPFSKETS